MGLFRPRESGVGRVDRALLDWIARQGHQQRCRAGLWLKTASATTCATAGTYYRLASTFAANDGYGFKHSTAGDLVYSGDVARTFSVDLLAGLRCDTANTTVTLRAEKNGVALDGAPPPPLRSSVELVTANKVGTFAAGGLVSLRSGDRLTLSVSADANSVVVTPSSLSLTLTEA